MARFLVRIEQVLIINKKNNARYRNIEINSAIFSEFSQFHLVSLKAKIDTLPLVSSDVDLINFWEILSPEAFQKL